MYRPLIKKALTAGLATFLAGAIAGPAEAAVLQSFSLAPPISDSLGGFRPANLPAGTSVPIAFSLAAPNPAAEESPAPAPSSVDRMPRKWRRALVQMGLLAVYATEQYWSNYHQWVEDWQFELTFADQYRRFLTTEAIRFDSNSYQTNFSHVMGGALYYQMARTNYLTWGQSLLATFANSTIYEYVSEWREVISVNDQFVTTFSGWSLGESWFQLSDYFHHSKSPVLKLLGFMNPINKVNQFLDRKNPASKVFPRPGWHDFVLSAGLRHSSETGRGAFDAGLLSLETQIIRTPEYGREGTFKKVLRDTSLSELSAEVALRPRPVADVQLREKLSEEVDLYARVVGLAWYRQDIDALGRGSALSIGLGSALTYLRKRPVFYDSRSYRARFEPLPATPTDFRDKMTVTHLIGPVVDWTRFGRRLKVRAVADAYVDFAMMNAFAFNAYSAVNPIEGMKTTLNYYGYYYAYGASVSGRVDVDWGDLWFRGLVSGHVWDSWEGLDRFEADLTNNVSAFDSRTRFLLKAGWRLPSVPLRAFVAVEGIHRYGRIGDIRDGSQETRTFAGLSYLF